MISPGNTVAVTGATGFIGTHLCLLLRNQGFAVRALVRDPGQAHDLAARNVTLVQGDLHNPDALRQLLQDCEAVVHGAGAVRGASQADFDRVNVAGTEALLAALATQARAPRLLHLSSIVAREPALSWYARSKRAGEERVLQAPGLDWVIVRPPAVYGPGDREMLPIFQWMRRGIALVPGSVTARTSLIHVRDLVHALLACLQADAASHQVLTLHDGTTNGYNWQEMARIAEDTWSRPVRLWCVPRRLLDTLARGNLALAAVTGKAPMLTPPKLRELRHTDWSVDNQAITASTGWTPDIALAAGMREL